MIPLKEQTPCQLGLYPAISIYGIYAFRSKNGKDILAADCKWLFLHDDGLWYMLGKRDVIVLEEHWVWIPTHAIDAIAFNTKPKDESNSNS